jgi:hypothetical protein
MPNVYLDILLYQWCSHYSNCHDCYTNWPRLHCPSNIHSLLYHHGHECPYNHWMHDGDYNHFHQHRMPCHGCQWNDLQCNNASVCFCHNDLNPERAHDTSCTTEHISNIHPGWYVDHSKINTPKWSYYPCCSHDPNWSQRYSIAPRQRW